MVKNENCQGKLENTDLGDLLGDVYVTKVEKPRTS
jgi:hypothetical protein